MSTARYAKERGGWRHTRSDYRSTRWPFRPDRASRDATILNDAARGTIHRGRIAGVGPKAATGQQRCSSMRAGYARRRHFRGRLLYTVVAEKRVETARFGSAVAVLDTEIARLKRERNDETGLAAEGSR